jgi:reverse gyrase
MRQLGIRECAQCGGQFAPTRIDARFCCRECLDKWFIAERKQAITLWREIQRRQASFFSSALQPVDEEVEVDNKIRRAG